MRSRLRVVFSNVTAFFLVFSVSAAAPALAAELLIELLIKDGTRYRTAKIDYRNGLRYPRLERIPGARARRDEILAAKE